MMTDATFTDYRAAMVYAATRGIDLDAQDDYCEICSAYHVGIRHDEAVPTQCGRIDLQGYSTVLECKRPKGHDGVHDNGVSSWGRDA